MQFKRRFWEEDEAIYGGISYTDLPIRQIAYPNMGFNRSGRGVLLGAYLVEGSNGYEFTAMTPQERVARAVALGSRIHPQYEAEFENGIAVAWHRVPFTLGCAGYWTEEIRAQHYNDLCQIDGRIVLAGEHASYIPVWQEGAILSASTPSRGCTIVWSKRKVVSSRVISKRPNSVQRGKRLPAGSLAGSPAGRSATAAPSGTAAGDERERLWERALEFWPPYADCQKKVEREIPVLVMDPVR